MNRLISFEGIDGCGKTTQIKLLSQFLDKEQYDYVVLREPGNTTISEKIRSILLDKDNVINDKSELLLFLSARAQLTTQIIEKKIKKNNFIICDRFIDSTLAYQGYGRGIDLNIIKNLNSFATNQIVPDITFILDVSVSTSIDRLSSKDNDRMENAGKEFLSKVRNAYIEISKTNNRYKLIDCDNKDINSIHQIIIDCINKFYRKDSCNE